MEEALPSFVRSRDLDETRLGDLRIRRSKRELGEIMTVWRVVLSIVNERNLCSLKGNL